MKKIFGAILVLGLVVPLQAGNLTQKYFDAFNIATASYVYNSSASAAASAGWIDVRGARNKSIVVNITTITATSLDIRIEMRWNINGDSANGTISGEIFTRAYTATTAVGDVIPIPEGGDALRVGLQVTGDAGAQDITISLVEG